MKKTNNVLLQKLTANLIVSLLCHQTPKILTKSKSKKLDNIESHNNETFFPQNLSLQIDNCYSKFDKNKFSLEFPTGTQMSVLQVRSFFGENEISSKRDN